MREIGEHRHAATDNQRGDEWPRQQVEPDDRQSESGPGEPQAREHHADEVEALRGFGLDGLDETGDEKDAEQADRNIDEEDPVPREIGGDEAAERRPDYRPDQRRYRDPGHGVDQRAL